MSRSALWRGACFQELQLFRNYSPPLFLEELRAFDKAPADVRAIPFGWRYAI
jgi:hypothetical protein